MVFVQKSICTGVQDNYLFFHRQRLILGLFQYLDKSFAPCELSLCNGIKIGTEGSKSLEVIELSHIGL